MLLCCSCCCRRRRRRRRRRHRFRCCLFCFVGVCVVAADIVFIAVSVVFALYRCHCAKLLM